MALRDHLRPRRSLVAPWLVVGFTVLYFVYRSATTLCPANAGREPCLAIYPLRYFGLALAGAATSYLVAVAVVAALDAPETADESAATPNPSPSLPERLRRAALAPSDATLVALAALVGSLAVYLVVAAVADLPAWLVRLAAPVGVLLGLPLAVLYGGLVVLADGLLGGEPPMAVQVAVVAAGVALSAAWQFALATVAGRVLIRR